MEDKRLYPKEAFLFYLMGNYKNVEFIHSNELEYVFLADDDHEYSFRLEEEDCVNVYSRIRDSDKWNYIDTIDNELIIL